MRYLAYTALLSSFLIAACVDTAMHEPNGASGPRMSTNGLTLSVPGDYTSIQAAINAAASGDNVVVAAGSYLEDLVLKSNITLQGAGVGETIIFGNLIATDVTGTSVGYLTLDGTLNASGDAGIDARDSQLGVYGVEVRDFGVGMDFVRSTGIVSVGPGIVDGCRIRNISGTGIRIDNVNGLTIQNTSIVYASGNGVLVTFGIPGAGGIELTNNVLYGNGFGLLNGAGYRIDEIGGVAVVNSIVIQNNEGLRCASTCTNDYNIVWGNLVNYTGSAIAGSHNKTLDPRFVGAAEGDFSLRFDSPAIDAGDPVFAPSTDIVGTTRPLGSGPDIGAYEFLSAPPDTTIAINEVMANPIDESVGEYIELYNFGSSAINVAGFVIDDGDATDVLAGWSGGTTVIPAKGYAVVLDPGYPGAIYNIPSEAVLLTVATTTTLGSGLSTSDPVKLFLADGFTPVDSYSFPFNPGNGISVEKDSIDDGDVASNFVTSPCGSSPGAENCASMPPNVSTEVLIAINEVMANPLDEGADEFIELYNFGPDPVDVGGMFIDDGDSRDEIAAWDSGGSTTLAPGQFALLLDPDYRGRATYTIPLGTLLLTTASTVTIGNGLANNDPISLINSTGLVVIDTYTHTFDAGNGRSVEKVDPTIGDIPSNFAASTCASASSPGFVNCVTLDGTDPVSGATISITEVMANPLDEDTGEFIELFNYGSDAIDLAGFRISDGDTEEPLAAFATAGNTTLLPGERAVIHDSEYAGQYDVPAGTVQLRTPDTSIGSGLSTNDPITLRAPTGADAVSTYASPFNPGNGISAERIDLVVGDVPSNWIASSCNQSAGKENCAGGGTGGGEAPISTLHLVISEVMANPLNESTGEYVEIFNAGPEGVNLADWKISDGDAIDTLEPWTIGSNSELLPGEFAVVLDPDYANDYTIVAGTIRLTVGNTTIGNGLATTDPITLLERDGETVVDTFSFPSNPGNGVSLEKVVLTSGDVQSNWIASTCRQAAGDRNDFASPGGPSCADPYGGDAAGTNTLGQPCPFGAVDCLSGLCAVDLLTLNTFCTEVCADEEPFCADGFNCSTTIDPNYGQICEPLGGPGPPDVVINEIVYDAVGLDEDTFIELLGPPDGPVDGLSLVGINGYNGSSYMSLPLSGRFRSDGYFVIARTSDTCPFAGEVDMDTSKADLQNGPDSLQLRYGDLVIDSVGYGAFSGEVFAGEGDPAVPVENPGESLARFPTGYDSQDNWFDFDIDTTPTPGAAND